MTYYYYYYNYTFWSLAQLKLRTVTQLKLLILTSENQNRKQKKHKKNRKPKKNKKNYTNMQTVKLVKLFKHTLFKLLRIFKLFKPFKLQNFITFEEIWFFEFFNQFQWKKVKKRPEKAIVNIFFQFLKSVSKYAYNDISYHNIWRNLIFHGFSHQKRPNLGLSNGHAWARMGEHVTKIFSINYFHTKNISRKFHQNLIIQNQYIFENVIFNEFLRLLSLNNGHAWARMGEHVNKLFSINYFHTKNISRKFGRNLMTKNRYTWNFDGFLRLFGLIMPN